MELSLPAPLLIEDARGKLTLVHGVIPSVSEEDLKGLRIVEVNRVLDYADPKYHLRRCHKRTNRNNYQLNETIISRSNTMNTIEITGLLRKTQPNQYTEESQQLR